MKKRWQLVGLLLGVFGLSLLTLVACVTPSKPSTAGASDNGTVTASITMPNKSTITIIGGDEATLRNFLAHWLMPTFPEMPTSQMTATIGTLPMTFPLSLTLSNSFSIIGAFVQTTGSYTLTQLFLSTEQSAAIALTTLEQQIIAQGFVKGPIVTSGFQPADPTSHLWCRSADELMVSFFSNTSATGATGIRAIITFPTEYGGPCTVSQAAPELTPSILPYLKPPPGAATVRGGNSNFGGDHAGVSAEIIWPLAVSALADQYADQLIASGWQQVEASATEHIAWSAWTVVDEEGDTWGATFSIVKQVGETATYLVNLDLKRQQ